jgi:pilus assembly protein Flp/PilA
MTTISLVVFSRFGQLLVCDEGQDLVEYALVVALIAFGAITGMGFLATGINNAFSGVATTLTANV